MKHFLVILLMSLLFSSCMKNYPEMVYEKALQYQQEGKYILGKSDDVYTNLKVYHFLI